MKTPRPSQWVFSLLASYGARRGGELPGVWFINALEPLGVSPAAVRQALYRLTGTGAVTARKIGRYKMYALTAYGRAGTDAGTERLLRVPAESWDEHWLHVYCAFQTEGREKLDRVRSLLELEGFANLSRHLFLHPRNCLDRLLPGLEQLGVSEELQIFRSRILPGGQTDAEIVSSCWNLGALRSGYRGFLRRYRRLSTVDWRSTRPIKAVSARFGFVIDYLTTAWQDPGLPLQLLDDDWPAAEAQRLAARLYRSLDKPLLAYGDAVAAELHLPEGVDPVMSGPVRK